MKRLSIAAISVAAALAATAAFAQNTTRCAKGDGHVQEFHFVLDDDGKETLDKYRLPRLVSSNCVPGEKDKLSFRGVNATFKTPDDIRKAIEGAMLIVESGVSNSGDITALIAQVTVVKAMMRAKTEKKASVGWTPFQDDKKQ